AAAKLGFAPIVAVDNETDAVSTTVENAQANGVDVDARWLDALVDDLPAADIVVANIALEAVEGLLPRVTSGTVVTSGYFERDSPNVAGWQHVERRDREGWAADLFRRA